MRRTQVVIVGSGIAGGVLSRLLAQAGIDHLLLHRQVQQREMALGETLPPSALPLLRNLGLLPLFEQHALCRTHGYHSVWGSEQLLTRHFFSARPFPYGLKLDKASLLASLRMQAKGSLLPIQRLEKVSRKDGKWYLKGNADEGDFTIEADFIVDATGRKRALWNMLGQGESHQDELIAFSGHFRGAKPSKWIHGVMLESFPGGWAIASFLEKERWVMTLFCRPGTQQAKWLKQVEDWEEILKGTQYLGKLLPADLIGRLQGYQANSSRALPIADEGCLCIGDAAMAFDPLSSHGISNAVYTAQKAVEAIRACRAGESTAFGQYAQNLEGIFQAYLQQKVQLYRGLEQPSL